MIRAKLAGIRLEFQNFIEEVFNMVLTLFIAEIALKMKSFFS